MDIQNPLNTIRLSVCVIGRNEGLNIKDCAISLSQLAAMPFKYETIFIDSASKDDSVTLAKDCFEKVISLKPSNFLNAGAARHVATEFAKGDWVLYLDGDMKLTPEIIPSIAHLIRSGRTTDGLCGFTENIYPNCARDLIHFNGNREGEICRMFGGAVLLPRIKVLEAGNWSCWLNAYEESELYSRLLRHGVTVIWHSCRMVEHKTQFIPVHRKIFGGLVPFRSFLGKKFYGAGQVTRLTLRNGYFFHYARLKPEPFIILVSIISAIVCAPWMSWYSILIPKITLLIFSFIQGVPRTANNACWMVQLAYGYWYLNTDYYPSVDTIFIRKTAVDWSI